MGLKFDGLICLKGSDRYFGHYWAVQDNVYCHAFGLWLFAVGWHWEDGGNSYKLSEESLEIAEKSLEIPQQFSAISLNPHHPAVA